MEEVMNKLKEVKHPEINNSLVELGMIGKLKEAEGKIIVELKLPMPEIPIKEQLINLIKEGLQGMDVNVISSVMNEAEREKFFVLAKQNWAL